MDNITIPIDSVVENGLLINEYLVLYNIANGESITGLIECGVQTLTELEKKGFIKLIGSQIHLREKSLIFFAINDDLFLQWLEIYPTMVKRRHGGKRALSPASADTILGKRLEKKWRSIFKRDIEAQQQAIRVLELQVKDMNKSGDLEYMVEAARWLNEGYHEKYSYLLDSDTGPNLYENEDYM